MNWKKNAQLALSISALGMVGCGGETMMIDPPDGPVYTYIVNTADVPEADMTTGRIAGFNLDGVDSTGASERSAIGEQRACVGMKGLFPHHYT